MFMVKLIFFYVYIDVTECRNNGNNNDDGKVNKLMQCGCKQIFLPHLALATF